MNSFRKENFEHKYTRRKNHHDYQAPCQYHIILKKNPDFPHWGEVAGDPDIEDKKNGGAYIEKSLLGRLIDRHIYNYPNKFNFIKIQQYTVMPDHAHVYLQVLKRMPKKLSYYITGLKGEIARDYSEKSGKKFLPVDIFQENFTDKIIYFGLNFSKIIFYIKDNPRRLAYRKKYPKWFERKDIIIDGVVYEGYGNHFLMDNPFKLVVRGHLRNTPEENSALVQASLEHVDSGGVLVSPFIHPAENEAMVKARLRGGKIIRIQNKPFKERYKPGETEFYECTKGNLLILAPKGKNFDDDFRKACKQMNALAERIVAIDHIDSQA